MAADRRSGRERRAPVRRPAAAADATERYNPADHRRQQRRSGRERRDESAWQPVPLDADLADEPPPRADLLAIAADARTRARARYSGFSVGAALETADGTVISGCNIENASYGLTLCAERVALVKALSEGHDVFTRIVVVADTPEPTPPCGPCRQLLWEYCGDIEVVLATPREATAVHRLSALLPLPFDGRLVK